MKKIWIVGWNCDEGGFDAHGGFFNEDDAKRVAEEDHLEVSELEVYEGIPGDDIRVLTLDLLADGTTAERTRVVRPWDHESIRPELKVDYDYWFRDYDATQSTSGRLIGSVAAFPYALSFPSRNPVRLRLKVSGVNHEAVYATYAERMDVRRQEAAW